MDQRKEPLRESLPHDSRVDHDEVWHERIRPSQERGAALLGGETQGRAALAAVGVVLTVSSATRTYSGDALQISIGPFL